MKEMPGGRGGPVPSANEVWSSRVPGRAPEMELMEKEGKLIPRLCYVIYLGGKRSAYYSFLAFI